MKLSPSIRLSDPAGSIGVADWDQLDPAAATKAKPGLLRRLRWFFLLVLLPTLISGGYYFGFAADQYSTETKFLIRARNGTNPAGATNILGSLLGGGSVHPALEESLAVVDYTQSLDAVQDLKRSLDLVEIWRRPEADRVAKLWYPDPEAERLLRYYRRMVQSAFDPTTGLTSLRVLTFRPDDSLAVANELLALSERLVNRFNERAMADSLRVAREEVALAEARVLAAREALTRFREQEQAMDPTASAASALETIGQLEAALAQTRAELQERQAYMRPDNPQIVNLRNRISGLTAQIAEERRRITTGETALTPQMATYERLMLEREFADRQLGSATASLESARADAQRQQLFLVHVVQPNLAEYPEYPRATFNVLTIFVSLSILYGIGWLVLTGIREHAN